MELFELIQTLVVAHGPSGDEGGIRECITSLVTEYADEIKTDTGGLRSCSSVPYLCWSNGRFDGSLGGCGSVERPVGTAKPVCAGSAFARSAVVAAAMDGNADEKSYGKKTNCKRLKNYA